MTFDEDSMPTPCASCGEIFCLNDGNPCHKCHIVYCPDCARYTDEDGWGCYKCSSDKKKRRPRKVSK